MGGSSRPKDPEQRLQGGPAGYAGGLACVPGSRECWLVAVPREQGAQSRLGTPQGRLSLRGGCPVVLCRVPGSLSEPHHGNPAFSAGTHTLAPAEVESLFIVQSCPRYKRHYCTVGCSGWVAPRSRPAWRVPVCGVALFRACLWTHCSATEGGSELAAGSWHSHCHGARTQWGLLLALGWGAREMARIPPPAPMVIATVLNEGCNISSG